MPMFSQRSETHLEVVCGNDPEIRTNITPMTHSLESGAIKRLHFLAPVFRTIYVGKKFLALKINMAESDIDDEFSEAAAIIIAGTAAKGKLKVNEPRMIISVMCTPLTGLEKNSVIIGARIWYQTNLLGDLITHILETGTRKTESIYDSGFWSVSRI